MQPQTEDEISPSKSNENAIRDTTEPTDHPRDNQGNIRMAPDDVANKNSTDLAITAFENPTDQQQTVAPGIIRTPMHARNGIEDADSLAGLHLLDRIGEPEEIANAALLLATSKFITGTAVKVDGGHVAGHALH